MFLYWGGVGVDFEKYQTLLLLGVMFALLGVGLKGSSFLAALFSSVTSPLFVVVLFLSLWRPVVLERIRWLVDGLTVLFLLWFLLTA